MLLETMKAETYDNNICFGYLISSLLQVKEDLASLVLE